MNLNDQASTNKSQDQPVNNLVKVHSPFIVDNWMPPKEDSFRGYCIALNLPESSKPDLRRRLLPNVKEEMNLTLTKDNGDIGPPILGSEGLDSSSKAESNGYLLYPPQMSPGELHQENEFIHPFPFKRPEEVVTYKSSVLSDVASNIEYVHSKKRPGNSFLYCCNQKSSLQTEIIPHVFTANTGIYMTSSSWSNNQSHICRDESQNYLEYSIRNSFASKPLSRSSSAIQTYYPIIRRDWKDSNNSSHQSVSENSMPRTKKLMVQLGWMTKNSSDKNYNSSNHSKANSLDVKEGEEVDSARTSIWEAPPWDTSGDQVHTPDNTFVDLDALPYESWRENSERRKRIKAGIQELQHLRKPLGRSRWRSYLIARGLLK